MDFMNETRGFRNNNPGNIRHGNDWRGEEKGDDKSFETFENVEHGIRALYQVLNTYRIKHRLTTVEKIISRWAPPSENDTKAYILVVLSYIETHFARAKLLDMRTQKGNVDVAKADLYDELVAAIIFVENGFNPFNLEFLRKCKAL